MRMPTIHERHCIEEMILDMRPQWSEAVCTNPDAPLPKRLPEVLGMTVKDAVLTGLMSGDPQLRHECAHEIWYGLPDRRVIHSYAGFNILCDLLEAEADDH